MTASTCGFIASYVHSRECELYLEGNKIVAYIPCKATWEATMTLGTLDFVTACRMMRDLGIEPQWN